LMLEDSWWDLKAGGAPQTNAIKASISGGKKILWAGGIREKLDLPQAKLKRRIFSSYIGTFSGTNLSRIHL